MKPEAMNPNDTAAAAPGLSPQGRATIVVVCTGNVCRSPYLEHLLADRLDRVWGGGRIHVSSVGVRGLAGESMTQESAALLHAEGIETAEFRARRLSPSLLLPADLVICATRAHRSAVVQLAPALLRRAVLLPELALALGHLSAVTTAGHARPGGTTPAGDEAQGDLSQWVRSVARAVVHHRPAIVGAVADAELDIDDPYGGPPVAYERMKEQIGRWLPDAVAVLSPPHGDVEPTTLPEA